MIVGVLGAGQLGRMMALAGLPLGLRFHFLDPARTAPADDLAERIVAPWDDTAALDRLANEADVITYEFENAPAASAYRLAEKRPFFPPARALDTAQDRLVQKEFFRTLGVATAPFAGVDSREDLERAVEKLGLPAVLKTRRNGYDGKGQRVLRTSADVAAAWDALGGVPLILEGFIPFEREVSIVAARGRDGSTVFYPLTENHHGEGILRLSLAPAPRLDAALQKEAERWATLLFNALEYVGVLSIECFEHQGRLLANEAATRVHNSGHWTIEGAEASQFENHVRAVAGLPLGSSALRGHSAMLNLIGTTPAPEKVLAVPGAHLHLYGKSPAPGRKLGHITVVDATVEGLRRRVNALREIVGDPLIPAV